MLFGQWIATHPSNQSSQPLHRSSRQRAVSYSQGSFPKQTTFSVVEGGGFEPPKSYDDRFTVCSLWPLGNPSTLPDALSSGCRGLRCRAQSLHTRSKRVFTHFARLWQVFFSLLRKKFCRARGMPRKIPPIPAEYLPFFVRQMRSMYKPARKVSMASSACVMKRARSYDCRQCSQYICASRQVRTISMGLPQCGQGSVVWAWRGAK